MSAKRRATTELNHDNWDQEDETEKHDDDSEEMKIASKDVLEKRVIRVAKRRSKNPEFDGKKSVFSGFTGFNKEQKSSFDFLANLTNANNTTTSTSLFGTSDAKPPTTSSTSLFNLSGNTNSPFGSLAQNSQSSVFGSPFSNNSGQSLFTNSKTETTLKDSSKKIEANLTKNTELSLKPSSNSSQVLLSGNQTTIFGGNPDDSKLKALPTDNTTPFKIQNMVNSQEFTNNKKSESSPNKNDDVKLNYYSKLKGLNESVSEWIRQHVEKTPLCILTPIFKDYEKYLIEIQDEYEKGKEKLKNTTNESTKLSVVNSEKTSTMSAGLTMFSDTGKFKSIFSQNTQNNSGTGTSSNFSFVVDVSSTAATSVSNTPSTGFSFGIKSSPSNTLTTGTNGGTPFSFGIGKPFSFNSNVQTQQTEEPEKEDEDTPPKVEYTPVIEENSVFDKKCKVFVKKDKDFIDKGVGTLYIKKIEESGKYQLLVRANTNLGNVLLNFILSSSLPTQRMGKNNVMLVCIPTPDAKPPPVPILIRVKTAEEADELLTTLDKYKT